VWYFPLRTLWLKKVRLANHPTHSFFRFALAFGGSLALFTSFSISFKAA